MLAAAVVYATIASHPASTRTHQNTEQGATA